MNFNTCMSCVAMITTLPLLAVHTHLESLRLCKSLPQNGSVTASQQASGGKKKSNLVLFAPQAVMDLFAKEPRTALQVLCPMLLT